MKTFLILPLLFFFLSISAQDVKDIEWMDLDEAVTMGKSSNKPTFIYIYSRGCKYSYQMTNIVFLNDTIVDLMENFIPTKFEAEYRKPYKFQGEKYENYFPYKNKAHQLTKKLLNNNLSYPTSILFV